MFNENRTFFLRKSSSEHKAQEHKSEDKRIEELTNER
jgi:hypothetical protein